jgi:hypothetical protein
MKHPAASEQQSAIPLTASLETPAILHARKNTSVESG